MATKKWRKKHIRQVAKTCGSGFNICLRKILITVLTAEVITIGWIPGKQMWNSGRLIRKEEAHRVEWIFQKKDGKDGTGRQQEERYGISLDRENWELQFYHIKEDIR